MNAAIKNISYHLPDRLEDNGLLQDENSDWRMADIEKKTGIKKRYVAAPGETAVDLGVKAAEKIFEAGFAKEEIDAIILVTQSPDFVLPASACIVQHRLQLSKQCLAFDVNQGCSGFVVGLSLASSLITAGTAQHVLLICSETYTKYIDRHDRTSRPVFSDGAAAVIVGPSAGSDIGPFDFGTDGSGADNLIVRNSGARTDDSGESRLFMNGSEVFMFTMDMVPKSVNRLLQKAGKTMDDVGMFIFHQASALVLSNIQRRLQIGDEKIFNNLENIGNTVSATIPIALKQAIDKGVIRPGECVMLVGFGVGYSWGSCLINYNP
ncbi:MAG: ketoacyl-ACP synthase III [Chitinophagaceae bacterium]|nr:ketoacyl-ACP synthase III [Chitinophagaceae bacterium]